MVKVIDIAPPQS